jgi:methionine-rich copper-binding protein CopC
MIRPRLLLLSLALPFLLYVPKALAHAMLVHSTPADQAVVHSRSVDLTLDYNSRIDARRSSLTLTGPGGKAVPIQIQTAGKPAELKAVASNLASGIYRIHWQVLASDGHITRGDITFTVDAR